MKNIAIKYLSRVTSGRRIIEEIDGKRFFCIFSVIIFHIISYYRYYHFDENSRQRLWDWHNSFFNFGQFGVQLFFIISGFILAGPFINKYLYKNDFSLKNYFWRRLTRLEPPYIINLLILYLAHIFVFKRDIEVFSKSLLSSLTYTHNIFYQKHSFINGVAWSLEIEVQFYILAPLICLIFLIESKLIRRFILITLICLFSLNQNIRTELYLHGQLHYFLIGILLCDIYQNDKHYFEGKSYIFDIVNFISWLALCYFYNSNIEYKFLYMQPLCFLLIISFFRGIIVNKIVKSFWIYTIGGMCYTFYLYHYSVISMVGKVIKKIEIENLYLFLGIHSIIYLIVIFIVCSFLFALIERPFMRIKK